jgi:hypothetical protein
MLFSFKNAFKEKVSFKKRSLGRRMAITKRDF